MKTALEIVLSQMVTEGWANKSGGTVDSPTGNFAKVVNTAAEVKEIREAFEDSCKAYTDAEPDWDWSKIVGCWLVVEDEQGFTHVTDYPTEHALNLAYGRLEDAYEAWLDENPDFD